MNNNTKGITITALGVLLMSFESLFIKLTSISPFTFSFYLGRFMFIAMMATLLIKQRDIIREVTKTSFYIFLFLFLNLQLILFEHLNNHLYHFHIQKPIHH